VGMSDDIVSRLFCVCRLVRSTSKSPDNADMHNENTTRPKQRRVLNLCG